MFTKTAGYRFDWKTIEANLGPHWRALFPSRRRQRLSFWGYEQWLWLGRLALALCVYHCFAPFIRLWIDGMSSTPAPPSQRPDPEWLASAMSYFKTGLNTLLATTLLATTFWRGVMMKLPLLERVFFLWMAVFAMIGEFSCWGIDFLRSSDPYFLFLVRTPVALVAAVGLACFEIAVRKRRRKRESLRS